jgi:hypothetical protein
MKTQFGIRQALTAVAAFGFVTASAASALAGDHYVSTGIGLHSKLSFGLLFDCKNSPGPVITLGGGSSTLGPIDGQLTFANNVKLTHVTSRDVVVKADSSFFSDGGAIQIPKQPSRSADYYGSGFDGTGVGGNPWIYVVLSDDGGNALKKLDGGDVEPVLLGRCVQGAADVDVELLQAILAAATVTHDGDDNCYNNPGPYIYIKDGIVSFGGVNLQVVLTNNAKFTHAASGDAVVNFTLYPSGTFTIPKQPPQGGVGGNPHVWFQFKSGDDLVGPSFYLGRCVQDL